MSAGNPLLGRLKTLGGWGAVAESHGAHAADYLLACALVWGRSGRARRKAAALRFDQASAVFGLATNVTHQLAPGASKEEA